VALLATVPVRKRRKQCCCCFHAAHACGMPFDGKSSPLTCTSFSQALVLATRPARRTLAHDVQAQTTRASYKAHATHAACVSRHASVVAASALGSNGGQVPPAAGRVTSSVHFLRNAYQRTGASSTAPPKPKPLRATRLSGDGGSAPAGEGSNIMMS
jgi:cell division septation protein DedD